MRNHTLPLPAHYDPSRVGEIWRVPYESRAQEAKAWRARYDISPASADGFKVCLLLVDVQNTFCIPGFELYVGGRSGTGAVDDNRRLCEFIYRNLNAITQIIATMDTHTAMQIFHAVFLINEKGEHPAPFTLVSVEDIEAGVWRFNPAVANDLHIDEKFGQHYLRHYVRKLKEGGKYELTIWPYHAMLGGLGHALVPAVEEAIFFHSLARFSQPDFQVKGNNPFTENYSVLRPEITGEVEGKLIAESNTALAQKLLSFDAVIIAGQAKSHCVAWTIDDLLKDAKSLRRNLAQKVYLLEDCTSPVVVPGVIDYTEPADAAFQKFAAAGMHLARSTEPPAGRPGFEATSE